MKILVINPGGGSTKIGIWENQNKILEQTINHSPKELAKFSSILEQYKFRRDMILHRLANYDFKITKFAAIATRGGPLKPLRSGTYQITEKVVDDIKNGNVQTQHPSLLGPLIAKEIGAYAVILKGKIDGIILTGGMTLSKKVVNKLKNYIKFLCPKIFVFPGEFEMEALALGAQRVLRGEEKEKIYA